LASNGDGKHVLFVLHSIKMRKNKPVGGKHQVLIPWSLTQADVVPVTYSYRLKS